MDTNQTQSSITFDEDAVLLMIDAVEGHLDRPMFTDFARSEMDNVQVPVPDSTPRIIHYPITGESR